MATRLEPTRNSNHFGPSPSVKLEAQRFLVEVAHLRHLARNDDGVVEVANGELRVHAIKSEGVSVNAEVNLTHFPASSGVNP